MNMCKHTRPASRYGVTIRKYDLSIELYCTGKTELVNVVSPKVTVNATQPT